MNAGKYLAAVEDVGEVVYSKLCSCMDVWSCPADPHLPHCHRLELKVPLSLSHSVRLLSPEHTDLIPSAVTNMAT